MLEPQQVRFWQMALQTRLVDEGRLRACWERVPPEKRTADGADRRLARRSVEGGLLTRWQAQQLLLGLKPQALWYDKYVLLDLLGQGGMGRVFLARDGRLKRLVAIKVLSRDRMSNPRALARFRREAKVGAQLQHEHLVRIYDEGEINGSLYLVMEYIEGKNVGQLITKRGPLQPAVAARIARQIAQGLQHAHEKGLVHRDVNPMNILIGQDGTAKLTDLGLAIDLNQQETAVTRDGATVGTFDYISPEQARHSRSIDIRSDIYSLGCTLYHMLAGRVPFPQPSLPEKLYGHQLGVPEPIDELASNLPPGLGAVVGRMMAKRPEERYALPRDVAEALAPFESGPATLAEIEAKPEQPIWVDPVASNEYETVRGEEGERPANASWDSTPAPESPSGGEEGFLVNLIDMGPPESISDSKTAATAARPGSKLTLRQRRLLIYGGGAAALLVTLAVLWRLFAGGLSEPRASRPDRGGETAPLAAGEQPEVEKPRVASTPAEVAEAPCYVRWTEDGSNVAATDLQAAIRQAVGKAAEVWINPSLKVDARASYRVSGGKLVVRAAPQTGGLRIPRDSDAPLFAVEPDASLELRGLSLTVEAGQAGTPVQRMTLIDAYGDVELDHCELAGPAGGVPLRLLSAQGRTTRVVDCWIRGPATPIEVQLAAGGSCTLTNTVVHAGGASDAGEPAIQFTALPVGYSRKKERDLTFERCTIRGPAFLGIEDVSKAIPLVVRMKGSVVCADGMVRWVGSEAFGGGLKWLGAANRYDLPDAPWVWAGQEGKGAVPGAPITLESWRAAGLEEKESRVGETPLRKIGDPLRADLKPADYQLDSGGDQPVGIDPGKVGAKAAEAGA